MNLNYQQSREVYLSLITRLNHVDTIIVSLDNIALMQSYIEERDLLIELKSKFSDLMNEQYIKIEMGQFAETKS